MMALLRLLLLLLLLLMMMMIRATRHHDASSQMWHRQLGPCIKAQSSWKRKFSDHNSSDNSKH